MSFQAQRGTYKPKQRIDLKSARLSFLVTLGMTQLGYRVKERLLALLEFGVGKLYSEIKKGFKPITAETLSCSAPPVGLEPTTL